MCRDRKQWGTNILCQTLRIEENKDLNKKGDESKEMDGEAHHQPQREDVEKK